MKKGEKAFYAGMQILLLTGVAYGFTLIGGSPYAVLIGGGLAQLGIGVMERMRG